MRPHGQVALVSGGASGLGLASVRALLEQDTKVVVLDLPTSPGAELFGDLVPGVRFVPGDVTDSNDVAHAVATAEALGSLRILIHTAGIGGPMRILDKEGRPASQDAFDRVLRINVSGTFNVLRTAAASMAKLDPIDGERGVCVLTSSIAAYEGRVGQVPYSAAKAAVVGMTLPAARDLARALVRVCTIAPGTFDTPLLGRLPEDVRTALAAEVPHPARLGEASEFASLAMQVVANPMLNGETIRLDGALRMSPR